MVHGNEGNKNSVGNIGGGRLKSGDVAKLLDLWNGKVKFKDIQVEENTVIEKYYEQVPIVKKVKKKIGTGKQARTIEKEEITGYKDVLKKRKVIIKSFKSANDAFAYNVLTGDKSMIKNLLDKLYADQRNVTLEDTSLPTSDKLRTMSNAELHKLKKQLTEELSGKAD